jgi:hypothetical protein
MGVVVGGEATTGMPVGSTGGGVGAGGAGVAGAGTGAGFGLLPKRPNAHIGDSLEAYVLTIQPRRWLCLLFDSLDVCTFGSVDANNVSCLHK